MSYHFNEYVTTNSLLQEEKQLNLLLVCNACIKAKIIICKSSLLNDNKALLENDAITFTKMLYTTHVTCILPTFLLFLILLHFKNMFLFQAVTRTLSITKTDANDDRILQATKIFFFSEIVRENSFGYSLKFISFYQLNFYSTWMIYHYQIEKTIIRALMIKST